MQETYDELYQRSVEGDTFTDLMSIITQENNIALAFRNIKENKGSNTPGTDGLNIDEIKEWEFKQLVKDIPNKLKDYHPKSVRRVHIPKAYSPGKSRPLGIPCIDDRLIQQCILQVLEPICEAKFYKHSYGFRPNRLTDEAIARTNHLINISGLHYAVDLDIKGFFDNVNHAKLLKQLWNLGIQDKKLL